MPSSKSSKKTAKRQVRPKSKQKAPPPAPVPEEEEESESAGSPEPEPAFQGILAHVESLDGSEDEEQDEDESEMEISDTESVQDEGDRVEEDMYAEEAVEVPKKRNGAAKENKKKKAAKVNQALDEDREEDVPIPKISFTISTFSAEELKKAPARRVAKSSLVDIPIDMAWVDAMGHFKIAICDLLFPKDAVVVDDAFEMTWTIPRIAPGPFALNTDAHYAQLINKVSKKSPMARIIVNEVQKTAEPNKENVPETPARDRAEGQAKPKAKSKARKEADILPANQAINDTIKSLREHWQCSLTTCKHDYCYIPADGPHFPLSHEHCEKWAAAILRGPTSATLDKPPNIQLFDPVSPHTIVSKSPILQARLNAKEKRDAPQQPPPPQPILQAPPVHIYNYQQPPVGVFGPAAGIAAAIPNNQTGLIPVGCAEGIKLDLLTFCTCYNIADDIRERLQLHRITGTHAFGHLSGDDLKEMGFKVGEIIDVKQAVKEWAVPMD